MTFAFVALTVLLGAGPPEVREVRVPASKVTSYFSPDTPLRLMSEAEYRDLLERARKGAEAASERSSPSLLVASHHASWEGGILSGRSELTIEQKGQVPVVLPLEPWTPALTSTRATSIRTLPDGRTALWIEEPGKSSMTVNWSVRARPGSRGHVFDLSLPGVAISHLDLDLPVGLEPEMHRASLVSSRRSGDTDRVVWRFDGVSGSLTIQLRAVEAARSGHSSVSAWVRGPTRIEVLDATASFEADWTVEIAPTSAHELALELDPDLQFVRLDGPDVVSVRTEPDGEATRVHVDLDDTIENSTRLRIHALCRVPDEGLWRIPSVRPLGAGWTGGRTVVWVGPNRVVRGQTLLSGWLVPAQASEKEFTVRGGQLLIYESRAPRSVAELRFHEPLANGSVAIRGILNLGAESPSLEATLTWNLDHGPLLGLPIDLPAGWTPGSVQVLGLDEPTSWRLEHRSGPERRIVVQPPPYVDPDAPLTIHLTAEADGLVAQSLRVPRIHPGFGRISDDLWSASTVAGTTLEPTRARGLAWIDPGLAATAGETSSSGSPPLSWRWTDPDGLLVLRRQSALGTISGECWTRARAHTDRTEIDWYVWIRSVKAGVSSVVLQTSLPLDRLPEWFVLGDDTGLPREVTPLSDADRLRLSIPPGETAFRVSLPQGVGADRPLVIHARLPSHPGEDTQIPLVCLSRVEHARGCVLISVDDPLLTSVRAKGLVATDRASARSAFEEHFASYLELASSQASKPRLAQAFDYGTEGGVLDLRSTQMDPVNSDGFLSELVLSTVHEGKTSRLRRLLARLPAGLNRPVEVKLPPRCQLERAQIDGRSVSPGEQDGRLIFDLLSGPVDAPQHELILDYQEPVAAHSSSGNRISVNWPEFSLPSLNTSVILDVPRSFDVSKVEGDFSTTAPEGQGGRRLDSWQRTPTLDRTPSAFSAFEARDNAIGPWNMTLGERLVQLDTGEVPLVIDRQALEDAGIGPRSRPRRTAVGQEPLDGFRDLGLVVLSIGRVLLVTTPDARPDRADGPLQDRTGQESWTTALQEAAARGSDTKDRLQSVTRWRGGLTPDSRPLDRPGRHHLRWSKVGPPSRQFAFQAVSRHSEVAWTIGIWATVLALGIGFRSRPAWPRLVVLMMVLGAGLTALWLPSTKNDVWPTGLILGALATLAFWVGQGLKPVTRVRPTSSSVTKAHSSSARAVASGSASLLILTLGLSLPFASLRAVEDPEAGPILVLLPYDQVPDPASPGPRFVLRLADFETLQALAGTSKHPSGEPNLVARSVGHHVEFTGEDHVHFSTTYDLVRTGTEPAIWMLPIGSGRDLSATLDGAPVPVRVEAEGHQALVVVEGEGTHRLVVSRQIELVSRDSLNAPVLPSALATLEITGQVPGRRIEVDASVGAIERETDHIVTRLGPLSSIGLRLVEIDRDPEGKIGTVDGLLLWNVEPAGDRIEARLSFRSAEPRTEIRLALEPGLEVRSASFPGWSDAAWKGTAEHPVWVAPATPPLPDGSVVSINLWRPAPVGALGPGFRPVGALDRAARY